MNTTIYEFAIALGYGVFIWALILVGVATFSALARGNPKDNDWS